MIRTISQELQNPLEKTKEILIFEPKKCDPSYAIVPFNSATNLHLLSFVLYLFYLEFLSYHLSISSHQMSKSNNGMH
ncbi:hypothetical protein VNO77_19083 [Canavalia gladiata]|uniref:Uncharacterized protein n=1 Tax=Canavalia gladiata TaxID=3824 RepID=A0AAN9LM08_CANGL